MRDWMVSSWTVALLFQQLNRYSEVLARAGRNGEAAELGALAAAMRADFKRHLVRDGTVAGYALFDAGGAEPELLLHPSDTRTGLRIAPADDPQHHRRHLQRRAGTASPAPRPRAPALSPTASG